MREPRNPFRLRASEHIESDATFVRLFGPGMLDVLSSDRLWERVHVLRSAPGGGKTSLMRLFTPGPLLTLHANRTLEDCKELYQKIRGLGAIGDDGPRVLGVMLSCARNYSTLADLDIDEGRSERLLFSLLNARVLMAALRGALSLKRLKYPQDLSRIEVGSLPEPLQGLSFPCNGAVLYQWAREIESIVCEQLDSFGPTQPEMLTGHDTLAVLDVLRPEVMTCDGKPIAERTSLMLDDVHKLTRRQRRRLVDSIVELRSSVGVWIAERYEALSADEMLSSGVAEGRDYEAVIELENYWRGSRSKRFESLVFNIADRRARSASDVDIGSFGSCLQIGLHEPVWEEQMASAREVIAERVRRLAGDDSVFHDWIAHREQMVGPPSEQALAWRTLEILIHREKRKAQMSLGWPLSANDLDERDDSAVRAAAEFFLADEFDLPYYFGPARLATIASSNIEQFLWLGGDEFEEVVSAALIKLPTDLAPERQEAILKKAVRARWNEIPQQIRNGREVRTFIQAVGNFARWRTMQPNAPYAPGVTGIAISMADRSRLGDVRLLSVNPRYSALAQVLGMALAHNLLEPIPDRKAKGDTWLVLALNRQLCVHFGLPLHYGGWKEQQLSDLCLWAERGFDPPKNGGMLL